MRIYTKNTPNSARSHYDINSGIHIHLITINNASLSHNSNHVCLLLNSPDFPRHHRRPPPVKAAISHGDHETAKRHRITAYELFRAQYRIPVPNQYPKYTIPCVRSLHNQPIAQNNSRTYLLISV